MLRTIRTQHCSACAAALINSSTLVFCFPLATRTRPLRTDGQRFYHNPLKGGCIRGQTARRTDGRTRLTDRLLPCCERGKEGEKGRKKCDGLIISIGPARNEKGGRERGELRSWEDGMRKTLSNFGRREGGRDEEGPEWSDCWNLFPRINLRAIQEAGTL